jgi:GNAT superfamily N-acetyltransferase
MKNKTSILGEMEFYPLTYDKWPDFELLFGEKGACGGCWCMWWRLKRSEFEQLKGNGNKQMMKNLIKSDEIPGIIALHNNRPAGWCSVAPREQFPALERSRILKRVDEKPVWSVVCFFIAKPYRKIGLTRELLNYAIKYCTEQGAKIIEGYPVQPKKSHMPDVFAYTGLASAFQKAGFKEVARRSETRPVMRYEIGK